MHWWWWSVGGGSDAGAPPRAHGIANRKQTRATNPTRQCAARAKVANMAALWLGGRDLGLDGVGIHGAVGEWVHVRHLHLFDPQPHLPLTVHGLGRED